jgi:hypothetical protein
MQVASGPGAIINALSKVKRADPVILLYDSLYLHYMFVLTIFLYLIEMRLIKLDMHLIKEILQQRFWKFLILSRTSLSRWAIIWILLEEGLKSPCSGSLC